MKVTNFCYKMFIHFHKNLRAQTSNNYTKYEQTGIYSFNVTTNVIYYHIKLFLFMLHK